MDRNSITNQDIKSNFVGREVFCHVGTMVDDLLKYDDELFEEIEWHLDFTTDKEEIEEKREEIQELIESKVDQWQDKIDNMENSSGYIITFWESKIEKLEKELELKEEEIDDQIRDMEYQEEEPIEILEWWAVSAWLGRKLKERGQTVFEHGCTTIWGRQTSGQAILLDGVISDICIDLELLKKD